MSFCEIKKKYVILNLFLFLMTKSAKEFFIKKKNPQKTEKQLSYFELRVFNRIK